MSNHWKLEFPKDELGILTFDMVGEKVNKFTNETMMQLDEHLAAVEKAKPKLLIIRSGKPRMFIAGADIEDIRTISDHATAIEKLERGQNVFRRLERLPCITVAVIEGPCLGGGMELALACNERWVSDDDKVVLGLPEVKLGLLPGWGGTQRLPRLGGLQLSLDMILTGKTQRAPKALKLGLADEMFAKEFAEHRVMECVEKRLSGQKPKKKKKTWMQWLLEENPIGLKLVFSTATKKVEAKGGRHYPALSQILKLLEETRGASYESGMKAEREAFSQLVTGQVAQNLIQVYFSNERLKKQDRAQVEGGPSIQSCGVLGAGTMGGGIAWLLAGKGLGVRLKDISSDALAMGLQSAHDILKGQLKRRRIKAHDLSNTMGRLSTTLDNRGFKGVDLVVEAVVERMEVKKAVLAEMENELQPGALLCTNTSALSITEMARALQRPEDFCGLHFFNPVHLMPLVEIIPGEQTSDQTTAKLFELVRSMGKSPVIVKDVPGFLVNRILLAYMNEAARCLDDGASIEEVDRQIVDFGIPMGPFHLTDEVGIDVGYHVAKTLESAYGNRMRLAKSLEMVQETLQLKGKKAGLGFYRWKGSNKEVNDAVQRSFSGPTMPGQTILERCIFTMLNEAASCIREDVVHGAEVLDMAMIMGTGFPPFRGGILRYADNYGIDHCVDTLERLAGRWGDRFQPDPLLVELAQSGKTFYQP